MQRLLAQRAPDHPVRRVKGFRRGPVVVEQAKVGLAHRRRALNDGRRSPIDGVVTEVPKNASDGHQDASRGSVVRISRTGARFRLPESALTALEPGAA